MNKLLPFLFFAFISTAFLAQTGTGIILQTGPSHTFTPTTVGDETTFDVQLINTVAIEQSVLFSGLDSPFALADDSLGVEASDTLDLSITFSPTSIGTFSDTLNLVGTIFGEAMLVVSGDGIQVQLTWVSDTLSFATTAIGQTDTVSLSLSSVGNGTAVISDLQFSNPVFTVDSAASVFNIAQDTTEILTFVFAPINAGEFSETVTLITNDPNHSAIVITLLSTGISEVSGEVCDFVWTVENSPYTLVGDIVVPEGCTLTVEAGVDVVGNNYNIEVFGVFASNGTADSPVTISLGEFISHSSSENVVLNYTDLTETNEFEFTDTDYRLIRDVNFYSQDSLPYFLDYLEDYSYLYDNENAASHIGKYVEDFSDNNCQGWDLTYEGWGCPSSLAQTCNGNSVNRVYDSCSSSYWGYNNTTTPVFQLNSGEFPTNVSFMMDTYNNNWGHNNTYIDYWIQVSLNGGGWVDLEANNSPGYLNNTTKSFDLTNLIPENTIQFRFRGLFQYRGTITIDNFVFTTSFYDGEDNPVSEALGTNLFSTGGIELYNSTFTGDFHSLNDTLNVVLENSQLLGNHDREKDSHGLGLYADHVSFTMTNSTISGHALDGVHIESTTATLNLDGSSLSDNGTDGLEVNGDLDLQATECSINGNGEDGIDAGANSNMTILGCSISNNGARGVSAGDESILDLDYLYIDDNTGAGVDLEDGGTMLMNNSRLRGNSGAGIESGSPVTVTYCDVAYSGGTGLVLTGNNFHTLNNSILWGNNSSNYTQIDISGGVISTSYSTVQGRSSYGTTGSGQYYWGEGVIEADPLFSDDALHLETFSPCVDGGQPWHQDTNMPFGLGGVRADMGIYGGPDNAYWGGDALPDGASTLSSISDSPQDQGGIVGVVFGASFYDNSDLVNNVTHYAFWRHYDPTGASISTLDEGSWELVGEMPSLDFNGYAYQASTLGNTNIFGTFNSCFTVVAHTDDDDTYWYSNVMCGESQDNLAPEIPEIQGMVLETGEVQIMWTSPFEEDYAYTEVTSDAGFTADISGDTLSVDATVELGGTYTYTAIHFDVNGNASDPSSLTLETTAGSDEIVLHAGWNLISTDRIPVDANVASVFGGLSEGNLQYVTGFNSGVQFYDPSGLAFLNSLGDLDNGYGYWVKVFADEVLNVQGIQLNDGYLPPLNEGWNLVGHTYDSGVAPEVVFEDLNSNGDLIYVTGFDQGVQVFDPNGLPFLNTLTEMRNGFGYWVKSAVATDGGVLAPLVDDVISIANPRYAILNGTSNLEAFAGEYVHVTNARGNTVSRLEILPGGYLMTEAVYEDELGIYGLRSGDALSFSFRGAVIELTGKTFRGDMEHVKLNLEFTGLEATLAVFPNPMTSTSNVSFTLLKKGEVSVELLDLQGRVHSVISNGAHSEGIHNIKFDASDLAAGTYTIRLSVDGAEVSTQRIIKSK